MTTYECGQFNRSDFRACDINNESVCGRICSLALGTEVRSCSLDESASLTIDTASSSCSLEVMFTIFCAASEIVHGCLVLAVVASVKPETCWTRGRGRGEGASSVFHLQNCDS